MFVVLAYDCSSQKRVRKALCISRKYLLQVQYSVFEGDITRTKFNEMINEFSRILDYNQDKLIVYKFDSTKYTKRLAFGFYRGVDGYII